MKFTGCTCVSCNNTFLDTDDVVVCPVCGSPHHRDCWAENGHCANEEKHSEDFSWLFPEQLRPRPEKPRAPEAIETSYTFKNGENAVMCPHCKALNYGNDAYCMRCRKPLYDTDVPEAVILPVNEAAGEEIPHYQQMPTAGSPEAPGANGFDYFQQFGGVRPDIMIDGIPVIEYADYIGEKKSGRYIRRFLTMERFGRKLSVSLCAFIFGPIWYFYRKMFKEGLIYLLALLVLSGIMSWCSLTEDTIALYKEMGTVYADVMQGKISLDEMDEILMQKQEDFMNQEITQEDRIKETVYTVAEVADLALMLGMAFLADYFYKKKTTKNILAIREQCSDMMTYRRTLHEKGGTSASGAVIGVIAVLAVSLIKLIPGYFIMFGSMM